MSDIVFIKDAIVLVGGGVCDKAALDRDIARGGPVVAADGGAVTLLERGVIPTAVIGDMDSLTDAAAARIGAERIHPIAEQDSTDFDKALRRIAAPLVLGHGFLGARLDHQLAALTVLAQRADRRCVLCGPDDVAMLCPPRISLALDPGTRVSLWPLGPVTGRSDGLRWPIAGLAFAPDGTIGTSNVALGQVTLQMDAPRMILVLPAECRDRLLAALAEAPEGWPVRA